ncbi:MAG: hypothetical protein ABR607_16325 [Pyrinomonadaceae bacterium]
MSSKELAAQGVAAWLKKLRPGKRGARHASCMVEDVIDLLTQLAFLALLSDSSASVSLARADWNANVSVAERTEAQGFRFAE